MKRLLILIGVTASLVVGCEGAGGIGGLAGSGGSTPEEVLVKAEAARQAGNWKTYVDCHTPETISAMVEQNLEGAVDLQAGKKLAELGGRQAVAQVEKQLKPLNDILAKHSIQPADLDKLADMPAGDARQQALKTLAAKATDRSGLAAELIALQHKAMTKGAKVEEAQSKIKSVTINGDRATAVISASASGISEFDIPMELRRTKAGWKIDNTKFLQP